MESIRRIYIKQRPDAYKEWEAFLYAANIRPEENVDYTCGIYEGDVLLATGSLYKNIIKCVAIHDDYQGGNYFNQLISHLMEEIADRGYPQFYVYTKPEYSQSFKYLGFQVIGHVDNVLVFLERAVSGFDTYLEDLKKHAKTGDVNAAIVMNANPFTKGHQFLVETASKMADNLYVFVVAEDVSDFPENVRRRLVEEGCRDFPNVEVLSTGNYMVSSQTFPSYFIKESEDVTRVQARLDASVFKERIAPVLGINHRYLGEEPLSVATEIYNESLKSTLEPDIKVVIIPRKEHAQEVISASRVRRLLTEGNIEAVKDLVPSTTFDFLRSDEGHKVIESMKTRRK